MSFHDWISIKIVERVAWGFTLDRHKFMVKCFGRVRLHRIPKKQ